MFIAQSIRECMRVLCVSKFNIYVIYFRFLKGEWREMKRSNTRKWHTKEEQKSRSPVSQMKACVRILLSPLWPLCSRKRFKIVDKQMFCQARSKACRTKQCARGDSLIGIPTDKVPKNKNTHTLGERIRLPLSPSCISSAVCAFNGRLWERFLVSLLYWYSFIAPCDVLFVCTHFADQFYTHTRVRANGVEQKVIFFYSADGHKPNHFVQRVN